VENWGSDSAISRIVPGLAGAAAARAAARTTITARGHQNDEHPFEEKSTPASTTGATKQEEEKTEKREQPRSVCLTRQGSPSHTCTHTRRCGTQGKGRPQTGRPESSSRMVMSRRERKMTRVRPAVWMCRGIKSGFMARVLRHSLPEHEPQNGSDSLAGVSWCLAVAPQPPERENLHENLPSFVFGEIDREKESRERQYAPDTCTLCQLLEPNHKHGETVFGLSSVSHNPCTICVPTPARGSWEKTLDLPARPLSRPTLSSDSPCSRQKVGENYSDCGPSMPGMKPLPSLAGEHANHGSRKQTWLYHKQTVPPFVAF
jgi:hypothetical protein